MKQSLALILTFSTLLSSGCSVSPKTIVFDIDSSSYTHEIGAVIAFYSRAEPTIRQINRRGDRKEVVGLILNCNEQYHYTTYFVGGLVNAFKPIIPDNCASVAIAHSHPIISHNANSFSTQDLATAKKYGIYLYTPSEKIKYVNASGVVSTIKANH